VILNKTEGPRVDNTANRKKKQDVEIISDVTSDLVSTSGLYSDVATLVEYPVDYTTSLYYYYPYFYKTHIISFVDEIDTSVLVSNCLDYNCAYCSGSSLDACFKCHTGFYLSGSNCRAICPVGYTTDTLRGTCVEEVTVAVSEVFYTKSYSVGSCRNKCGYQMSDCSCDPSCKQSGNCCSDYENSKCDRIVASQNCTNTTKGCEFCEEGVSGQFCTQCAPGYYFFNRTCSSGCPQGYVSDDNYACVVQKQCNVENCEECDENNHNICRTCKKGAFLSEGKCGERCAEGYRADRISWTCLEAPVFAWYWVYPSTTSCRTHCGTVISSSMDCSCGDECFYYGNCCQDIEDYCPQMLFWRKKNFKAKALRTNLKKENVRIVSRKLKH